MKGFVRMKKQFTTEYLEILATSNFITAYHYRVMLMLLTGNYTQAQMADKLHLKKQNIHKCIKDLEKQGLVEVDRIEGKNKFLKAVTSVKMIQAHQEQLDGQLSLEDE